MQQQPINSLYFKNLKKKINLINANAYQKNGYQHVETPIVEKSNEADSNRLTKNSF